jgi:hypothetical protein
VLAVLSAVVLLLPKDAGSRGLKDFDSALIGYAVASVFALAAVVHRYTLWITRPPTWRYFRAGWVGFSWRNVRFFGFPVLPFPVEARTGFALVHALDVTAVPTAV